MISIRNGVFELSKSIHIIHKEVSNMDVDVEIPSGSGIGRGKFFGLDGMV